MDDVDRKRPAPPKPTARKGKPLNAEYEDRAKAFLRHTMDEQGVTIADLTEGLARIGVRMSPGGVANKISRGGFSSAFLMQCMDALGVELEAASRERANA